MGDAVPARGQQSTDRPCALPERTAGAGMAEKEGQGRQPAEVDVVAVGAKGDVVSEVRRDLGGVGHAAHPRQHLDVEQSGTIDRLMDPVRQPDRDLPRPEQVRHRLPKPEVGRQGEGRQQVGQRDLRALGGLVHGDVRSVTGGPPPDRPQSLGPFVHVRSSA